MRRSCHSAEITIRARMPRGASRWMPIIGEFMLHSRLNVYIYCIIIIIFLFFIFLKHKI